jgi:N,N'-diacetyllegionaminate synthase
MSVMVIAECGVNHNGDIKLAKLLVNAAKNAKADAVKFQSFIPEKICRDKADREYLETLALPLSAFKEISDYCNEVDIEFMATPECPETLHFLMENTGMKKIKIGSGDITNSELLKSTNLYPEAFVFLSTGMATIADIEGAIYCIENYPRRLRLLHCVSCYPTFPDKANLLAIKTLSYRYGNIGYSDHTLGDLAPIAAVAMGACVIEKHLTLGIRFPGPDHILSMEPPEFLEMVNKIRTLETMFGTGRKEPNQEELELAKRVRKGPDGKRGLAA